MQGRGKLFEILMNAVYHLVYFRHKIKLGGLGEKRKEKEGWGWGDIMKKKLVVWEK